MLKNSGLDRNMILPVSLMGRLMGKQKDALCSGRRHLEAHQGEGTSWGGRNGNGKDLVKCLSVPSLPWDRVFFPAKPINGQVYLSNYAMRPPVLCSGADAAHQWHRAAGEFPLVFRKMFIRLKCPFHRAWVGAEPPSGASVLT